MVFSINNLSERNEFNGVTRAVEHSDENVGPMANLFAHPLQGYSIKVPGGLISTFPSQSKQSYLKLILM